MQHIININHKIKLTIEPFDCAQGDSSRKYSYFAVKFKNSIKKFYKTNAKVIK